MDGTLTIPMHDFQEIRMRLGIPKHRDILGYISEQEEAVRTRLEHELESWEHDIAQRAEPAQDAVELLEFLRKKECQCAVLTRNTQDFAMITLQAARLLDYFDPAVILGRDSAEPKPSPAGIYKILSHWDAKPESTVMIGDDINDVLAGKNAGCSSVFVERNRPLANPGLADILCRDLKALIF